MTDTIPVISAQVAAVDNADQEIHDVLDLSQALATANNKQLVETIARL